MVCTLHSSKVHYSGPKIVHIALREFLIAYAYCCRLAVMLSCLIRNSSDERIWTQMAPIFQCSRASYRGPRGEMAGVQGTFDNI